MLTSASGNTSKAGNKGEGINAGSGKQTHHRNSGKRRMAKEMIGQKYGRLTVAERVENNRHSQMVFRCECDCGNQTVIVAMSLRSGHTKSCGCLMKDVASERLKGNQLGVKHGDCQAGNQTAEHRCWVSLFQRCYNPENNNYHKYGARGISVCSRWFEYENFLSDMGRKPSTVHSIDHIDNDGNYEPANCRWATWVEQNNNQRPKRPRKVRS